MAFAPSAHPLARRAICIGLSALLVACGGGGSDEPVTPPVQPGTQARGGYRRRAGALPGAPANPHPCPDTSPHPCSHTYRDPAF